MPKVVETRVYELVKSLSPEESKWVRANLPVNETKRENNLQKIFDLYSAMEAFNEVPLRRIADFSRLKQMLWDRMLEALREFEARKKNPTLELNRILDYMYVLNAKNLHHLAVEELKRAKQICNSNDFIFSKGLVSYYHSLSGNYIQETNLFEFWADVIGEQQKNLTEITDWHRTRIYYLKVVEAEKYRSAEANQHEVFPAEKFTDNDLFEKEDISKLSLTAAMFVAQARRTIYLWQGDIAAAYEADMPIVERLYKAVTPEYVAPEWEWSWLLNRCNTHDYSQRESLSDEELKKAPERLVLFQNDLARLEELYNTYYLHDDIRTNFIIRTRMELKTYLYSKRGKTDRDKEELHAAMMKTKQFLRKRYNLLREKGEPVLLEDPYENPVVAFTLSSLLLTSMQLNNWQLTGDCCTDFSNWINETTSPDIHRFVRFLQPIVDIENSSDWAYTNAQLLLNYAGNHYDAVDENGQMVTDSYKLERVIGNNIKAILGGDLDKRKEYYAAFADDLKKLQNEGDRATIAYSDFFPFRKWAEYKAGLRNDW